MAIPLSAIRKYTPEIIALSFVAIVLGAFWSIIDTYQPSYLLDLRQNVTDANNATAANLTAANLTAASLTEATTTAVPTVDLRFGDDEVEIVDNINQNVTQNVTYHETDEFGINAPKIIKFALTGELDWSILLVIITLTIRLQLINSFILIHSRCHSCDFCTMECRKNCRLLWPR